MRWIRGSASRLLRLACFAFVGLAVVAGAYALTVFLTGNFHTVIAGELYRSAQLSEAQTIKYVQRFGIKTIINLRGLNDQKAWYRKEIAVAKQLNVAHIDFAMYTREHVGPEKAAALIAVFKAAEKPILIHCESGADRSALAAALYVAAVAGQGEAAAEAQFSMLFGHFGALLVRSRAIDQSWETLEPWLGFAART